MIIIIKIIKIIITIIITFHPNSHQLTREELADCLHFSLGPAHAKALEGHEAGDRSSRSSLVPTPSPYESGDHASVDGQQSSKGVCLVFKNAKMKGNKRDTK